MSCINRNQITEVVRNSKAAGKTLVFTNGCFDIIHAGHVRYLAEAKKLGDYLIVGLNSDRSVKELKGPNRPINHQDDRAEVIAALAAVDYVVIFDERTAENLINEVKPDIYVKGGDYCIEDIPEASIVANNGGKTVLIPEVPGRSSTNMIKKITETT
jgi:rfaE bifunctional protein nucleotidyltransferase chain/domain